MEHPAKRGRGRPPKEGETKRAFFQTRIRASLKERLEASAAEEGRSLSEEIELRLEGSYDRIESRFGGPAGLRLAQTLLGIFEHAGSQEAAQRGHPDWTLAEWFSDRECFEGALRVLVEAMWGYHPQPVDDRDFYRWLERLFTRRYGRELTRQYDEQLRAAAAAKPDNDAA